MTDTPHHKTWEPLAEISTCHLRIPTEERDTNKSDRSGDPALQARAGIVLYLISSVALCITIFERNDENEI